MRDKTKGTGHTVDVVACPVEVVVGLPLGRHLEGLDEDDADDHQTHEGGSHDATQCSVRTDGEAAGKSAQLSTWLNTTRRTSRLLNVGLLNATCT